MLLNALLHFLHPAFNLTSSFGLINLYQYTYLEVLYFCLVTIVNITMFRHHYNIIFNNNKSNSTTFNREHPIILASLAALALSFHCRVSQLTSLLVIFINRRHILDTFLLSFVTTDATWCRLIDRLLVITKKQ